MKKLIIFIGVILVLVLGITFYLVYPAFNVIEKSDERPVANQENVNIENNSFENEESAESVNIISQGEFIASAHDVKGKALIVEENGEKILRFEDFETINGPDLRIYLSNDLNIDNSIDLGPIKATKGNVNYELDSEIDIKKYDKVLVWCRAFRVLFSYSDLN